jgi:hypothetical protein
MSPHSARFSVLVQKKIAATMDASTHWLQKAICACTRMNVNKLKDGRYRIQFFDPSKESASFYEYEQTRISCDNFDEYSAYTRAFFAIRPARYIYPQLKSECDKTKNLPQIKGDPKKLYEHTRKNTRLLDIMFIDWANMMLLSRFNVGLN